MALTELQGNPLLDAEKQAAEGQYAIGDFGLGFGGPAVTRGLDVVHQVGLQLQRRRSPGALAQEVIRILEKTLGYDNIAILLVDRSARQLKPFALSENAYGKDFGQAYERYVTSHDMRLGTGVAGWVAHHGQALLYGDMQRETRLQGVETEMRSALFVPIRVEGVVIGTLGTESRLVDIFTRLDQQLLETVAGQVAIAIQNAHLFSRVSRQEVEVGSGANGNGAASLAAVKPVTWPIPEELIEAGDAGATAPPVAVEDKQPAGRVVAPEQVTPRGLVADLRAQIEELDAFNHTVAHDLKNPLSILLGFAEVMAEDHLAGEDEVLDQAIRVIIENGRRMENIINELLLLAEVRVVEQIPVKTLDMPEVVSETCRRLSNLIKENHTEVVLPGSWPSALGHQPWVEEIWVNYMSNAIRYGGPSPRVELGGEILNEKMARFWVRDYGQGISEEDQRRLFVPFSKLQQASTKGHGLGLSIVQRITKRLGGAVGVESEQGKGSLFWFTLPLA